MPVNSDLLKDRIREPNTYKIVTMDSLYLECLVLGIVSLLDKWEEKWEPGCIEIDNVKNINMISQLIGGCTYSYGKKKKNPSDTYKTERLHWSLISLSLMEYGYCQFRSSFISSVFHLNLEDIKLFESNKNTSDSSFHSKIQGSMEMPLKKSSQQLSSSISGNVC